MSERELNPLTELLRPHVKDIAAAHAAGDQRATQIITLYQMHCSCPSDPGARAFCTQALLVWLKERDNAV